MTRFKRRKLMAAAKFAAILLLPFGAAAGAKVYPEIKDVIVSAGNIRLDGQKTESSSASQPEYAGKFSEDREDIVNEQVILSEGYGVAAEEAPTETAHENPLDMVSADPGEKPYPSEWNEDGGVIVRTTYGKYCGNTFFDLDKCGQVNNKTTIPNETLIKESRCFPDFTFKDTDEPQVLIYHTHTTESFEPYVRQFYDASFNYRTTDDTKNMVMVGNAIQAELEAAGIHVIHASAIHDYPSYNGSYDRSRATIEPILAEHPSIKVALDIHRDAISSEGTAYQPVAEINGREAAQIMIISGCDDGTLGMPNYIKNFRFASFLQQGLEADFPGLTRPILFDYRKYNQDLTTGSLLIEVGSHGNTLEQVQYSGQLIGEGLARVLKSLPQGG